MKGTHSPKVWAEVDLGRLKENLRAIRSRLAGRNVEILAIVKADAYGHGMKQVALTLRGQGVNFFGVANIDEAVELRRACPKEKILVLGCFHQDEVPLYLKYRVRPTLSSLEDASLLEKGPGFPREGFPVHVKVDTGMGRLGVWHEEAESFFSELAKRKRLSVEGIYTHFANADRSDKTLTERQIKTFNDVVKKANRLGFRPRYLHAANSLGLLRFKKAHLNLVRPGIVLYGMDGAGRGSLPSGIHPILSLKTRISFLKNVEEGRALSYGSTYISPGKSVIATLPVGYSHGYRVGFSNKAFVFVRDVRCPVVGRVTMDHTLVDVGKVPGARRWDEVILIGQNGKAGIRAETLAEILGTVPYEITCAIHGRIPRVYLNSKV